MTDILISHSTETRKQEHRKKGGPTASDISKPMGFVESPSARPYILRSAQTLTSRVQQGNVFDNIEQARESALAALKGQLDQIAGREREAKTAGKRFLSETTLASYDANAKMLVRQYCAQTDVPEASLVSWLSFAEWLLSRRYDWCIRTWHVYLASICFLLERMSEADAHDAVTVLKAESGSDDWAGTKSTGMNRIKKISPADFDRIMAECARRGAPNTQNLAHYLTSSVRTGLRPTEYLSSVIRLIIDKNAPFGRQAWLFVCNAKYSNGQANGPVRMIDLSNLDNSAMDAISMCIADARTHTAMNGYESWIKSLNNTMRTMAKSGRAGIEELYTAYSARHQAIASWKSVYSPVEVAALAGHAFPDTAVQHYGCVEDAWPAQRLTDMLVRPSASDVARIERRMAMAKERQDRSKGTLKLNEMPETRAPVQRY